jgi:hypothetical protein
MTKKHRTPVKTKGKARKNIKKLVPIYVSVVGMLLISAYIFIKKDIAFQLTEPTSNTAISGAEVFYEGKQYTSDSSGFVVLPKARIGKKELRFFKPFYESGRAHVVVGPFTKQRPNNVYMKAVGEVVQVTVRNRLNDRPIVNALVKAKGGGQGRTGQNGKAVLVLETGTKSSEATVTSEEIISATTTIFNANDATTNVVRATPVGKVYTLQKFSNGISVLESNMDGTEPTVVVAGTGYEDSKDTQLLQSAGARYVALKSIRDELGNPRLYMYDTVSKKLDVIDDGTAHIIPVGWLGSVLVYRLYRPSYFYWQNDREVLLSYDAVTKKTTLLDSTKGEGDSVLDYAGESFESTYLIDGAILYAKKWQSSYYYGARFIGKKMVLLESTVDGQKTEIGSWQAGYNARIKTAQAGPGSLNVFVELDGVERYNFVYKYKKLVVANNTDSDFTNKQNQAKYYTSPNGILTAWTKDKYSYSISRTGSQAIPIPLGSDEYYIVGWYDNDYLLIADRSSHLYTVSRNGVLPGQPPLRVGVYFRSVTDYRDFGYGY